MAGNLVGATKEGPSNSRKIIVSNLPPNVGSEDIQGYFESEKRTGGGPITQLEHDEATHTAVIQFEHPDSVSSVLARQSIRIARNEIDVKAYSEPEPENAGTNDAKPPGKILVSNIPSSIKQEDLEVYFENEKRTGGGPVEEVDFDSERGKAVIEFKDPETVDLVLTFAETSGIILRKTKLTVEIYSNRTELRDTEPPRKIFVANIPEDVEQEDLEVYFENEKRTGGGPVENVEYDSERRTAVIEFQNPDNVESVLSFAETSGIILHKTKLTVEIYNDGADESAGSEPSDTEPPKKILVANIPEDVEQEDLEMYFENEKRTGGGPVEKVEYDSERRTAVIEFQSPDVVKSVLTFVKTSGIRLRNSQLNVESYCEKSEKASEPTTTVIIKNLPAGTTEELLEMFCETKSNGGTIKTIEYNKENGTAILDFEDHQSVECLLEQQSLTFRKTKITIESYMPVPIVYDTICVRGSPKVVTEENMEMYFESKARSGGGPTETIEIHEGADENTVFITFASEEVAKAVAERTHTLMKMALRVTLHDPTNDETDETDTANTSAGEENNAVTQEEPQNTIKVKGLKGITSPDTVRFYFENKRRAGGGTILDFSINEDDGEALITFESDDVAKDVLGRSHTIEGRDLKVIQYRSPALRPYYRNKVLVTGVGSETSEDCLLNFLEAKSGTVPTEVMYGEDAGCKLVTFESEPDLQKLQSGCDKTSLEGRHLCIEKVKMSNCIIVSNFNKSVTADTLELYFENSNRSGGGPVEKIDMRDGYCRVYFENHEDIKGVISKEHSISGETIDITLLHECLGENQGEGYQQAFHCPSDLSIEVENDKLKYLLESKTHRDIVEKKMTEQYASVVWPKYLDTDKKVTIKCRLEKDVTNCCGLAKSWQDKAKDMFDGLLDDVTVTKFNVSIEIWPNISNSIREINARDPTKVLIALSRDDKTISVTGEKETAEEIAESIGRTIGKLECDIEIQRRTTVTRIPLNTLNLKAFEAANMKHAVEERARDISISINHETNEILITGTDENVGSAERMVYESTIKFASQRITVSPQMTNLLSHNPAQQYLQHEWKKRGITAVWQTSTGTIDVCVIQGNKLTECIAVLNECFCEEEMDLDVSTICVTQSDKWTKIVTALEADLKKKFVLGLNTHDLRVALCSTADVKEEILDVIHRFLSTNTILTEHVEIPMPVAKYLNKHVFKKLQNIAHQHKNDFVNVNVNRESRMVVSGNKVGVKIARQKVEDLSKKVQMRRKTLYRPGLAAYMTTQEGKDILPDLEKKYPCVIETELQKKQQRRDLSTIQTKETFMLEDGRTINLFLGDITDLPVDSIICAADKTLTLTAGVGKSIITKGGVDIRNECTHFLQKHKELKEGQVMSTSPGALDCNNVFFVNGPQWAPGKTSEQKLREVLIKAMDDASRKMSTSIAFPAICCGRNGFQIDIGARTLVGALKTFFDTNPQAPIRQVFLVDINMVDNFSAAVKSIFRRVRRLENQEPSASCRPEDCSQPTQFVTPVLVKGRLAKEQVDVIVNTTNHELDLMQGVVSTAIMKAAGPAMKPDLDKEYPEGIKHGDLAYSPGYKLKCTEVFHMALLPIDHPNALKRMRDAMKQCLLQAHRRGYSSIAFPVLGTGSFKYPVQKVSEIMFETVKHVSENEDLPEFTVNTIRFVVHENDNDTLKVFDETSRRWKAKLTTDRETWHSNEESDEDDNVGTRGLYYVGDMALEVKTGDLTNERCDCIVNSTDALLNLNRGAVATALLKHAGQDLEKALAKKRPEMQRNGIVITDGYNLPCYKIIHVEAQQDGDQWKNMLLRCLQFADNNGVTSIAFPAIGSGLGMKTEDMAKLMFTALTEFQTNRPKQLNEVRFVLFDNNMFKEFCTIVDSALEQKSKGRFGSLWSGLTNMLKRTSKTAGSATIKRRRKEDTVYFTIYADTDDVINEVTQKLSLICDKMTFKKTIERDVIKRLDNSQKNEIETVCRQWNVDVTMDIEDGAVHMDGMQSNEYNVVQKIYEILHHAALDESSIDRDKSTPIVVQWYYIHTDASTGKQKLVKYDAKRNKEIEASYSANSPLYEYTLRLDNGETSTYFIDLHQMKTFLYDLNSDPRVKRKSESTVYRRHLFQESKGRFPETWVTRDVDDAEYSEHKITKADEDFKRISKRFEASSGGGYTISSITRIENPFLWKQYQAKKKQIFEENPPDTVNERFLWHGTKAEAVASISRQGFNRRYCGENATAYGKGVYFAERAGLSCQSTYAVPDESGNSHVYFCHVLTGEYQEGTEDASELPDKPSGGASAIYESLVDNAVQPGVYVIFHDTQAYPEYLITFKSV